MRIKLSEKILVLILIITIAISGLTGWGNQETEMRAEIEPPEASEDRCAIKMSDGEIHRSFFIRKPAILLIELMCYDFS